ncbi:MAG TPA: DNA polymerase III subunit epsilon [Paenalcaligenes sp.]|nr:DNA polymerase III subunit epsilon [Paenalcaligenes sp.]
MRQVILDTETTGLDPAQGHRIVEFGGVELIKRRLTGNNLHRYVNPGRDSDPEALGVHGLTTEFLSEYPPFESIAAEIVEYVKGAEVIIHNAPFDVRFLDAELERCGFKPFEHYCGKITDSLAYARGLHPGRRNSLDVLCDRYGISNEHRVLHGALLDAELLADVWLAMTRGQESLVMGFSSDTEEVGEIQVATKGDAQSLPVIQPSEQAIEAHNLYLQGLEKEAGQPPLWKKLFPAQ